MPKIFLILHVDFEGHAAQFLLIDSTFEGQTVQFSFISIQNGL